MSDDAALFKAVVGWFETRRTGLEQENCSVELKLPTGEFDPDSILVVLETEDRMGELILWSHGLADVQRGLFDEEKLVTTHHEVMSSEGVVRLLDDLVGWVLKKFDRFDAL